MCTNYEAIVRQKELEARFNLTAFLPLPDKNDVRPTDTALVVTAGRQARLLTWGIPAPWDGKPLVNARAETLTEKPTFRPLLENRCLVPAAAYFEWRRDGRTRLKNRIAPADGVPFAFAGLMDETHFTIVTCTPAPGIAHIHPRMPVILDIDVEAAWIDPDRPFETVRDCLIPFAAPLAAEEERPRIDQPDLFGNT